MNCRIQTIPKFDKDLKRLAKRYRSLKDDFARLLASLKDSPTQGTELGSGLRKVRMSITERENITDSELQELREQVE